MRIGHSAKETAYANCSAAVGEHGGDCHVWEHKDSHKYPATMLCNTLTVSDAVYYQSCPPNTSGARELCAARVSLMFTNHAG